MKKLGNYGYMLVGFLFLVVVLIAAGSHFGNGKETTTDQNLSSEEVSFGQLLNNPHAYLGKYVDLQARIVLRGRKQITSLPNPQWLYGLFCMNDTSHFGSELLGIRFATKMDGRTLPVLKNPTGLKRLYGIWQQTEDGEFFLDISDAKDVADN